MKTTKPGGACGLKGCDCDLDAATEEGYDDAIAAAAIPGPLDIALAELAETIRPDGLMAQHYAVTARVTAGQLLLNWGLR